MDKVLYNRYVLYFILFLSLGNLYYFVQVEKYNIAALFILVGFITSFFSKNMVVIFTVSLVIANILNGGFRSYENVEGMTSSKKNVDTTKGAKNTDSTTVTNSSSMSMTQLVDQMQKLSGNFANIKKGSSSSKALTSSNVASSSLNTEVILKNYKELLTLQNEIKDAMDDVNGPLTKAENIISNMKNQLGLQMVQ